LWSLNIGNHTLRSRGYPGKEKKWAKEDAKFAAEGIQNPCDKFADPLERAFGRSRYKWNKVTQRFETAEKTELLMKNWRISIRNVKAPSGPRQDGTPLLTV